MNKLQRRLQFSTLALAASFVLTTLPGPLHAQDLASITGTVMDSSSQVIPAATVQVKSDAAGTVRTTGSDRDGRFGVSNLAAGTWSVEVSAAGFATQTKTGIHLINGTTVDIPFSLTVGSLSQTVTVEAAASQAAEAAPSLSSLDAISPESVITQTYLQNFMSPVGDYSDAMQMTPGTFSVSSNGPGLGDTKIFFRGFKDGFYNMTFDGLPFNDTNDPTHHSWVWFPTQFLGSTIFDRSPGDATSIGPSNSGGAINLQSKETSGEQIIKGTVSYGSFNTRLLQLDYDSGLFGGRAKKSSLLLNVHQVKSDGYQTFNKQDRWGGSAKYQFRLSPGTVLTAFTGIVDLAANTPNVKGPTRAAVARFGDNYLLNNNPADPLYYNYSFYQIPTDFEYVGIKSELGHGWRIEDKVYTNRYYNHQQYNGATITATSGTDKLNSYRKFGDSFIASQESRLGTFRGGTWYEVAYTDRFQIPTDPRTWLNAAVPNFHEKFVTQSLQPFGQYDLRVTRKLTISAGVKVSNYNQHLNQFADNGKTVGNLGGLAFVGHTANYRAWQPNAAARYRLKNNWSAYFQYATGNVIPPTTVFDTKNASVSVIPKPTSTIAYQFGTVVRFNRITIDADAYFIRAQNPYSSSPDRITGEPVYFLGNDTFTKGFELESNVFLGHGFNLYLNGTIGTAKYDVTHLWVASAPHDTETTGLFYLHNNWDLGFFNKRIGQLYNDNGGINQGVFIHPFNITNAFFNYTMKGESRWKGTKLRFSLNNLFDQHNITGVTPGATRAADTLTLMAGRAISVTATFGYSPKK